MFLDPLGITIGHEIQPDVMLQESFEAREHQREPLSGSGHLFHQVVSVAGEAGLRDADEGRAVLLRRECPFHRGEAAVSRPLHDNALVQFDGFGSYWDRDAVHFPIPLNLPASLELSAAPGEPEFRGDVRIDKSLEHLVHRLADKHSGLCDRHSLELEILHTEFRTVSMTYRLRWRRPYRKSSTMQFAIRSPCCRVRSLRWRRKSGTSDGALLPERRAAAPLRIRRRR